MALNTFIVQIESANKQELSSPTLIAILFCPRSYLVWSTKHIYANNHSQQAS